mmetsp:Transcript_19838/g.27700  ORF Transcript_19838/g.27700 Transcript_19838/m.27700 type:complete len:297 (+) Transcript_19838:65-955(+)
MESPQQYAKLLTKITVAQTCKELGFESVQESVLDSLTEITKKYIEELGRLSHRYTELAARTETNFYDIYHSFKDLGVSFDDLSLFGSVSDDLSFPKAVAPFPIKKNIQEKETGITTQESRSYIPSFLPPLPSSHAYVQTPLFADRMDDPREIRKLKSKQKRQTQASLARLNEKLGNKPVINYHTAKKLQAVNTYLIPPQTKDKQTNESTDTQIQATPIQRDSPFMRSVIMKKLYDPSETLQTDDHKRVYTELEESERMKKRQRAEMILNNDTQSLLPEIASSSVKPPSGAPFVERL